MNVLHGNKIEGRKPKLKHHSGVLWLEFAHGLTMYNVLWHAAEEKERSLKTQYHAYI